MPNPGTFTGSRGEFLREQRGLYAQSVKDGNINDIVTDIQRRYFKRYPITLPHDEEPTQEWLDQVNDDSPDPEIESPNVNGMSPEDASTALKEHADLMKKLKDRKDSIRRRLHYMFSKENDAKPSIKLGMGTDIVSALTAKILSIDAKLPRLKTAYNVWGPQHRELVDPVFNKRVEEGNIPANQQIALRSAIYKELFDRLPEDERELWSKAAIRDHEKAVREIRKNLEQGASTTPQDRQRVITALPAILEPIFDLLAEYTGWRFSGMAGGPEPADGGRLNMIMIHSGVIPGTVKADFGSDQHEAFKKYITPSFGSYLKKCFSIDECQSRALPTGFDIRSLADVSAEEAVDLHSFEIDKEHLEASKSHKAKRLLQKEVKSRKLKKPEPPQTGTPSPPVRFGPPIGKKKLRELPSKDKPSESTKSSPLTSGSIATSAINDTAIPPASSPTSNDLDANIFSQGFVFADLGELPEKRILSTDENSALNEAVASVLEGYVSTAARSDPPTPAPSRDPIAAETHEADASSTRRTPAPITQNNAALSSVAPKLPPPSPAVSRPASPTTLATCKHGPEAVASPSRPLTPPRPVTPPAYHARPPSRSVTPPSRHATPPARSVTPPSRHATPPSRPATASHPSVSPLALPSTQSTPAGRAVSQAAPRLPTPSGAVTVPEFPPSDNIEPNNKKRAAAHTASGGTEKRKAPNQNGDAPKKKQRITSGSDTGTAFSPAFPFNLPSDCPSWVLNALDLLTKRDLGSTWRELVAAWVRFEEKAGFDEHRDRLASQGRPMAVGQWIKRKRAPHYLPDLGNLDRFEASFVNWWNSLQPDWRNAGIDSEVGGGRSGDDWSSLEGFNGVNGFLSTAAALQFWGSAASTEDKVKGWSTAAGDVLYVLQQLA